ncbi:Hsp20/alpha crystallin family protein, partial [Frankia sp. CiP1_Cm_nod1]
MKASSRPVLIRREHTGQERSPGPHGRPWSQEGRSRAARRLGLREDAVRVEEYAEDGAYVVRAELPGIDPDRDVEVTVSDKEVSVHAERREERREKATGRYRSEFRYGSLTRSVTLPPGVKKEEVAATYHNGILEVRIPVAGGEP